MSDKVRCSKATAACRKYGKYKKGCCHRLKHKKIPEGTSVSCTSWANCASKKDTMVRCVRGK